MHGLPDRFGDHPRDEDANADAEQDAADHQDDHEEATFLVDAGRLRGSILGVGLLEGGQLGHDGIEDIGLFPPDPPHQVRGFPALLQLFFYGQSDDLLVDFIVFPPGGLQLCQKLPALFGGQALPCPGQIGQEHLLVSGDVLHALLTILKRCRQQQVPFRPLNVHEIDIGLLDRREADQLPLVHGVGQVVDPAHVEDPHPADGGGDGGHQDKGQQQLGCNFQIVKPAHDRSPFFRLRGLRAVGPKYVVSFLEPKKALNS